MYCMIDMQCLKHVISSCRYDRWIKDDDIIAKIVKECVIECYDDPVE